MILVWHVISQDCVTKGLCHFMGRIPLMLRYHPAKFDRYRLSGSGQVIFLSLTQDLDVVMSPEPASLVSFASTPPDVPACQFWWVISFMGKEISILMSVLTWIILKMLKATSPFTILRDVQNQEYQFTILNSQTRLVEKQEEKEHKQLQSVMHLTQTQ